MGTFCGNGGYSRGSQCPAMTYASCGWRGGGILCDMTLLWVCVTWPFYECDMTCSSGRHDSFMSVPWLMPLVRGEEDMMFCMTWLFHACQKSSGKTKWALPHENTC